MKFLYCEKVDFNQDLEFGLKLLKLADKYLAKDFEDLCIKYLRLQINSNNFSTIFNYALENNLPGLEKLCTDCFESILDLTNFLDLIQCINKEGNPELISKAFDFILQNFEKIHQKGKNDIKYSEDFLIQNMTRGNIQKLMQFLETFAPDNSDDSDDSDSFSDAKKETANLREAVYGFLQRNWEDPQIKRITKKCSKAFLLDVISYLAPKLENVETEIKREEDEFLIKEEEENLIKNQPARETKRIHKRKEPGKPGKENIQEERPELKKTKKTFGPNGI